MKIRQAIKKAVALGTGALMLGATILGASAVNVNEYPSIFLEDGKVNAKIIVGETADAIDVVGAIDIAADLQAAAVSKTSVKVEGAGISVTGGKTDKVAMNTGLNTDFGSLDEDDLPVLQDTSINVDIGQDKDYDVSDKIVFGSGISVETGLTSTGPSEDFKDRVFLEVSRDAVKYVYTFDEALDANNYLTLASSTDPVTIEFLGQSLNIIGADADTITVEVGTKHFLNAGDSVDFSGKTIKLVKTSENSVVVDVDGVIGTVDDDSTEKINGLKIKAEDIFNDDGTEFDSAKLTIGDDVTKSYDNGDEYIKQDSDDPDWVWEIGGADGATPSINVSFDQTWDEANEVLYAGDELTLPNGFATISIDSLTQTDYQDYKIEVITDDIKNLTGSDFVSSGNLLHFEAMGGNDNGFQVDVDGTTEETDDVYLHFNTSGADNMTILWKDPDNNKIKMTQNALNVSTGGNIFSIDFKDSNLPVNITDGNSLAEIMNISIDDIKFAVKFAGGKISYLGNSDSDNDKANDVSVGTRDVSGWKEDTLNTKGIKIYSYKTSASSDELKLSIPKKTSSFQANVVVKGSDAVVSSGGSTVKTETVNPIGVDFGVLDSDAPAAGTTNLIVVGGPCVNTVAARLLGNPTPCSEGFAEGEAKLAMFADNGKVALLVAGGSGQDTMAATRALVNNKADLPSSSDAKVITTNTKNPSIE